ncbi:MAG: arylesterase [Gammaproteobacteria bacterium]|nr:arylesterase [Gammaproteobacteria bacterium]
MAAAALLLAFALAGCSSGPELTPLGADARVVAFGDSLTFGTGAPARQGYPEVLAELTGLTVINAGVPGETTTAGRQRLPGVLAEHSPALVILIHGGNDTLRRQPPETTRDNLAAMIGTIRASGAQVVMLAVPGASLTLAPPAYYAEVADAEAVPMDDGTLRRLMRSSEYKSDQVHFNARGYRLLAEAVRELLLASGAL